MDLSKTLLLGFIAGVTIVIGLPIGRLRAPMPSMRLFLNAMAIGMLLFLVWDVLSAAWEPVDGALARCTTTPAGSGRCSATARCSRPGWRSGCSSLVAYDRYMAAAARRGRDCAGPGRARRTSARTSLRRDFADPPAGRPPGDSRC